MLSILYLLLAVLGGYHVYGFLKKNHMSTGWIDQHVSNYLYRFLTFWLVLNFVSRANLAHFNDINYWSMIGFPFVGFAFIWIRVRGFIRQNNRFSVIQGCLHPSAFLYIPFHQAIFGLNNQEANMALGSIIICEAVACAVFGIIAKEVYETKESQGIFAIAFKSVFAILDNPVLWGCWIGLASNTHGLAGFCLGLSIWAVILGMGRMCNQIKLQRTMSDQIVNYPGFFVVNWNFGPNSYQTAAYSKLGKLLNTHVYITWWLILSVKLFIPIAMWLVFQEGVSLYVFEVKRAVLNATSIACTYIGLAVVGSALWVCRNDSLARKDSAETEQSNVGELSFAVAIRNFFFTLAICGVGVLLKQPALRAKVSGFYMGMPHSPIGYMMTVSMTGKPNPFLARLMFVQWVYVQPFTLAAMYCVHRFLWF